MKELKNLKEPKKKPGQFQKTRKRNLNIQHNRDQLKLLKEQKIEEAELFVLDGSTFKKVTIKNQDPISGNLIVYVANNGKKSKLQLGHYIEKDAGGACRVMKNSSFFIDWKYFLGIVVKEEILKEYNV